MTTVPAPGCPSRRLRTLQVLAVAVFLLHAAGYLYFFVDDAAIAFVHAQSVLDGRGLTYPSPEGRTEGFSNFLHVALATAILGTSRLLGLPLVSVFFIGKAISLACGAAIVWLVASTLARLQRPAAAPAFAALGVVALAGPLAVWSCSSMETVPFALGVAVLVYALSGPSPLPFLASAAAVFLALERVDGWLWAGGFGAAYWLLGSPVQRRLALRAVLVPAAAATIGLEVFRLLYFGAWAPMPFYAKVLFKLQDNGQLVQKLPPQGYAARFVGLYGAVPLLAALAVVLPATLRRRELRPLALAILALTLYVSVVGDWMFGFRFFVPMIAPAAILLGAALEWWPRRAAWAASIAAVAWSAVVAGGFERQYVNQVNEVPRENFWSRRSFEAARFFGPYYGLARLLGPVAPPGTLIAYNQAGLIPFLLDTPNIDTLGICSRFYAELPATDVAYTEVGRYEPATAAPVISARRAYLINQAPRFVVERTDLLLRNNGDRIPDELFGGYFRLLAVDEGGLNAVYQWAGRPNAEFRRDPASFLENLAHVSNLERAVVDGQLLRGAAILPPLGFLRERGATVAASPTYHLAAAIAPAGALARQIYVDDIRVPRETSFSVVLRGEGGVMSYRYDQRLEPGSHRIDHRLPDAVPVRTLELRVDSGDGQPERLWISDFRLMGQGRKLAEFVRDHVPLQVRAADADPGAAR